MKDAKKKDFRRDIQTKTILAAMLAGIILSGGLSFGAAADPLNIPRLTKRPRIDGVLDNPFWEQEALKIENFVQLAPKENGAPSQRTVAYLGYDDKNLYMAFRCFDAEPGKIRASITSRDNAGDDDWIFVFLDTFNEKRRASSFMINPLGVQMDAIRLEQGGGDQMDMSWDTAFDSEGTIDNEGYTVEMAIPFKSLRFPDRESKVWNVVLGRNIPRNGEIILWPNFSRSIPGLLSQGKEMVIQGSIVKGKNLEIMPILTSLKREGEKINVQPGANIKYGLNSNSTLDMTLNPDFSHIEADAPQIDVNLRYALRYPEKRPFFMEGMEIFQHPEIEMVYTRRIIDPAAGAKISGKLGPVTYGVLSAYDLNPSESLWNVHGAGENKKENALFNIVRLKADVFKESYVGLSVADKEIDGSWNRVAGLDGQFKWKKQFFFTFQALASKTSYDDGVITPVSPALFAEFSYNGRTLSASLFWKSIHPDFEASSGFVNRMDYRSAGASTSLNLYPDKKYLNAIHLNFSAGLRDNYFDDIAQDRWLRANAQLRFTEFNRMFIRFENAMERYENREFKKNTITVETQSNIIGWLPFGLFFQAGDTINYDPDDTYLGWSNAYGLSANFKPSKRLQMGLDYSKETYWKRRGGGQVWDYNVVRQRTTYQFSKSLSLRAIVDYNFFYDKLFGSVLFSYVLRPGTVFFFGVDSNYLKGDLGKFGRENYNVFVKFSYWWRV